MVTAAVLVFLVAGVSIVHAETPLPQPRPAEAPGPAGQAAGAGDAKSVAQPPHAAAAEPAPPSACRLALTDAIAIAPSIPAITGPGACGGDDLVRLEAVVLPDNKRVALKPAAIVRCTMASAIADWIRTDMAPLAAGLGTSVADLDNFDSFECRGRNRVVGAKLSEHGRANALDVRDLKLANGQSIGLTDRSVDRAVRERVLQSMCARFTTVLGPGSDGYHEDHIHIDLAERHNNYRICHWNVYDALPPVAPQLPAPRPDDAPHPEVASIPPAATAPEPAAAPPAASAPVAAPQPPVNGAEIIPLPRPAPADRPPPQPKVARQGISKPSMPQAITPDGARAKPVKHRRRRRQQPSLPPFLRSLLQ